MNAEDKKFYEFLSKMLKRKKGDLYKVIEDYGCSPAAFAQHSGIDPGNLSRMNQCAYKGAVSFWVKVWRAL